MQEKSTWYGCGILPQSSRRSSNSCTQQHSEATLKGDVKKWPTAQGLIPGKQEHQLPPLVCAATGKESLQRKKRFVQILCSLESSF